jgi:hypothetical protein
LVKDRIDTLQRNNDALFDCLKERKEIRKEFIDAGNFLFKNTNEGKKFFKLAYKLYGKPNEDARDSYHITDSLMISRLNGEDYILRKIIYQFINNRKEVEEDE